MKEIVGSPQAAIAELQQKQETLIQCLDNVQVTNDEEQKNAEDMLISAKFALKQADEKRKELTRPLDESKKRIMALFEPYISKLNLGLNALNLALHTYHKQKQAEIQAEQEYAMAMEAARLAEAKETGELIKPAFRQIETSAPRTSYANLGSVTYREDYDIQIVDPNLVPRDLCEPSMSRIRARVKSGITNIPGCLITPKYTSATRLNK